MTDKFVTLSREQRVSIAVMLDSYAAACDENDDTEAAEAAEFLAERVLQTHKVRK